MVSVRADATVALTMLMDRLSWPVKMVRWKAAKAIRGLIEDQSTRAAATARLLQWLGERPLESEVASGLSVFLIVAPDARPGLSELCSRIARPSLLSEMLVEKMYGRHCGGWEQAHSGVVPVGFLASKYFEDHKAAHVPRIFSNRLEGLGELYGLPLMRQWAYEWQALTDETRTVATSYPSYLGDFALQRSGVVGQFVQRQAEVFRSAYLRTLAFAVSEWGMPLRIAAPYLFHTLSTLPDLFNVEPQERPKWLGQTPAKSLVDGADLEAIGRRIVNAAKTRDWSLVALGSPFPADRAEFGDLTLAAFFITDDFVPSEEQELDTIGDLLYPDDLRFNMTREALEVKPIQGRKGTAISVCSEAHPIFHGFWHDDYFQRGLSLPAPYCFEKATTQRADVAGLKILLDGDEVAKATLWHDAWSPLYGKGSPTRYGIATTMRRDKLNAAAKRFGMKIGWFVRVAFMKKVGFSDLEPITRTSFFN